MAEENTAEPNLFARSVVLRVPGVEAVEVIRDQPWGDERAFDLYRPPGASEPAPVVVFVTGFPDPGFRAFAGCALKDTAPYRSWARLLAASGLAAVTYTNVEPATDARAILEMVEHPTGPHAFDVMDGSDVSRRVIRRILGFLREQLAA